MPRTHEDIERHEFVDHRPAGPPILFALGQWCAIAVANVAPDRVGAGISTYETLIEKARASAPKARACVVCRSTNNRRVISLVALDGHAAFGHLAAAWDDHHRAAQHHAVAESQALTLYRVVANAGTTMIDMASTDAYALERVAGEAGPLQALPAAIAAASGFRGLLVWGTDDARGSAIMYRFEHAKELEAYRASPGAIDLLGRIGADGEALLPMHPVKTFS